MQENAKAIPLFIFHTLGGGVVMSIIIISLRKKKYFHILISSREGARKSYGKLQHFKAKWLMHNQMHFSYFQFPYFAGGVCVVNQCTYFNTIIILYFRRLISAPGSLHQTCCSCLICQDLKKSHISNFSVITNRIMFCSGHYPEWTKMGGPCKHLSKSPPS